MLPFTMDELAQAVMDGDVTARAHPYLPYIIYNYSPDCQYRNKWNDITLTCRGLILDFEGNIIARPWKKFFNLGQVDLPIQLTDPVEVMDKADGSLGILYPVHGPDDYEKIALAGQKYSIATRGSFMSEQALHATKVWNERYSHLDPQYHLPDYTILFEIVYPENRIVLNYDGMDDLILLGAVNKNTGYYMGPREAAACIEWDGPVVEVFPYKNISEALGHMERKNAEGYVIRSHNFMVKLKQPDYLDLHRLVTNMTPKSIWEKLRDGKSVSEICADLPDEFHSMAEGFAKPLVDRYNERLDEIMAGYSKALDAVYKGTWGYDNPDTPSRKQYANVFTKSKDSKYYFALLDNRVINELLWNELKPREEKGIINDDV